VSFIGGTEKRSNVHPYAAVALSVDTKSTGRCFQVMARRSAVDKIPPGPQLDALTAQKVFGWKKIHKHEGTLVGKRQDKAGHCHRLENLTNKYGRFGEPQKSRHS
jgi:hypothetical protein